MNKFLYKIYFLALAFFIPVFLVGQDNAFVKGKINDKANKETLPGVTIAFGTSGVQSDPEGNYFFATKDSVIKLSYALLGYKTRQETVILKRGDTSIVNITLEPVNQVLDEVVISAGKFEQKLSDVTVSMEVIKPSLLENKAVQAVDQVMNQVPSVNVADGQVSIRGGSGFSYGAGSRVLMLVDEMPMISADAGDIKWNYLPIENLEQIEVIKGASSALFGSSALNGVINLRTAYAKDKPITSISSMYGVYGKPERASLEWWKGQRNPEFRGTSFSHLQKIGNLDFVLAGNLYDNEGFRYKETETRGRVNMNLRYNFKKIPGLSIGVNTNYMNVKGGLFFLWHNDSLGYTPRDSSIQGYDNIRYNIDPFIVYNTEKYGRHSLRTRQFRTVNTNDKNQGSKATLNYAEYQWQKRFAKNFTLTTGLVYMDQVVSSDSLYGVHHGHNRAAYVQLDKKVKRLTMSLGLRAEYFRVDTSKTKGTLMNDKITGLPFQPVMRAGVNYQLFEYTFLRSSFGQGYRFPTVAEKYISTYVSSLNIFPNQQLQPERGWSAEIGIKQGFRIGNFKGFADVAGFWTEYRNMMDFVFKYDTLGKTQDIFNAPNPFKELVNHAGFQSQNIGAARITGYDISISGTGKIGKINITLLSGYTYTNPINPKYDPALDSSGITGTNLLKYRNRQLFKNDIQLDYKKISIGFSSRYNSFMENIDKRFNEPVIYENLNPATAAYNNPVFYILPGLKKYRSKHNQGDWMHDFRISYQFTKELKMSFVVNNVFNHEYMSRPGFIEAPRTYIMQVNFKF
ncbi:MAG: TonB-dependent receptor [Bacteroidia bacterium]